MKKRIKTLLNNKKKVLWVTVAAVVVFAAAAVYFLANPARKAKEDGVQDERSVIICWFDYQEKPSEDFWGGSWEIMLPEFPDVTFRASYEKVEAVTKDRVTELFDGMPIWNTYFTDLDGDGIPELCATVSYGSGIIDEHIIVYDYAKGEMYTLWERGIYDYVLKPEDGKLVVWKGEYMDWENGEKTVKGSLCLAEGEDGIRRLEMTEITEITVGNAAAGIMEAINTSE